MRVYSAAANATSIIAAIRDVIVGVEIGPSAVVDDAPVGQSLGNIGYGIERLVLNGKQFERILGQLPTFSDDHGERLAHITNYGRGQRPLQKPLKTRKWSKPDRYLARISGDVFGGKDVDDTGQPACIVAVDSNDTGMCMRAAHHDRVCRAFKVQVIDKDAAAGQKSSIFDSGYRLADELSVQSVGMVAVRFRRAGPGPGHIENRFHDGNVAGAPADIARDGHANAFRRRHRCLIEKCLRCRQHSRSTKSTLQGVPRPERLLQRHQFSVC